MSIHSNNAFLVHFFFSPSPSSCFLVSTPNQTRRQFPREGEEHKQTKQTTTLAFKGTNCSHKPIEISFFSKSSKHKQNFFLCLLPYLGASIFCSCAFIIYMCTYIIYLCPPFFSIILSKWNMIFLLNSKHFLEIPCLCFYFSYLCVNFKRKWKKEKNRHKNSNFFFPYFQVIKIFFFFIKL